MILNSNKLSFDQNKLIFKKSRQCSNDFTFIPLRYDNNDILIPEISDLEIWGVVTSVIHQFIK